MNPEDPGSSVHPWVSNPLVFTAAHSLAAAHPGKPALQFRGIEKQGSLSKLCPACHNLEFLLASKLCFLPSPTASSQRHLLELVVLSGTLPFPSRRCRSIFPGGGLPPSVDSPRSQHRTSEEVFHENNLRTSLGNRRCISFLSFFFIALRWNPMSKTHGFFSTTVELFLKSVRGGQPRPYSIGRWQPKPNIS